MRLDPKFALAWALLSYVDAISYLTLTLQPTRRPLVKRRGRPPKPRSLFSRISARPCLPKGYYHYACLKDYDTAVRYFEQARKFLPNNSRIPESLGPSRPKARSVGPKRSVLQRSASDSTRATLTCFPSTRLSYILLRRFPEALRKL